MAPAAQAVITATAMPTTAPATSRPHRRAAVTGLRRDAAGSAGLPRPPPGAPGSPRGKDCAKRFRPVLRRMAQEIVDDQAWLAPKPSDEGGHARRSRHQLGHGLVAPNDD